jgi:uncharacterized protein (TIGR03085 family)
MTGFATAYADLREAPTGPALSKVERALLCDLFDELGAAAPTLCEGWDTHHLVAHLRGRESGNPLRVVASAVPRIGDRSVDHIVARHDYSALVREVRDGPPRLSLYRAPRLEPLLNSLEYFIHHEDVRRAQPGWTPRDLPRWAEDQIWGRTLGFAKLTARRAPTGVVLQRSDTGRADRASTGDESVTVRGLPSEIALHLSGRAASSRVELLGPSPAVAAYTAYAARAGG